MQFLTKIFKEFSRTIERAVEGSCGVLEDFTGKGRIDYTSGEIVVPREMTVLEQDDAFKSDGSISINVVTPDCLLLVLENYHGDLRVFALRSGEIGYLRAEAMTLWLCDV